MPLETLYEHGILDSGEKDLHARIFSNVFLGSPNHAVIARSACTLIPKDQKRSPNAKERAIALKTFEYLIHLGVLEYSPQLKKTARVNPTFLKEVGRFVKKRGGIQKNM